MLIPFEKDELRAFLADNFSPSRSIKTPERLVGREVLLEKIDQAFETDGKHVFIYGERGVGKSSLAMTAAFIEASSRSEPIPIACSNESTFEQIFTAVRHFAKNPKERYTEQTIRGRVGFQSGVLSAEMETEEARRESSGLDPLSYALDTIDYVIFERKARTVIIIDEFDRIQDERTKVLFSEFIKNIGEANDQCKIIFCGIANDVSDLLKLHGSAGRYLTTLEVPKLSHDALWEILKNPADRLEVVVPQQMLVRISKLAEQFPNFVHLFGKAAFRTFLANPSTDNKFGRTEYVAGIDAVIDDSEFELRDAYRRATMKSANKLEYEMALWSLSQIYGDQAQIKDIYQNAYLPILKEYNRLHPDKMVQELTKDALSNRLHTLRDTRHGEVIDNHRAGWFSFRENMFRGYCRFKAEDAGVTLTDEIIH